ncbi:ATP-grasp domain-containing protein [Micromonospora sp. DT229]|uniref:ATP-grasp domain-containing protein n=1 Tax=Micromonospora sp. DT229 TaxID=3393430 RepID=UPI003CF907E5
MPPTHPLSPRAFVLTGAFRVICRNHRLLAELARRGLGVLVLCPDTSRAQVEAVLSRPGPAADLITEVAYAAGAMDRESSFNPDVLAVMQDWRERYEVTGLYAMEESLVEPSGLAADMLGLPSPGLRASRACRSKYLQRCYLPELSPPSLTVPAHRRATVDLHALKYPVVVKPTARHASSGVLAANCPEAVADLLGDYPCHETLLIEQRVEGQEFSVESLVQHGQVRFAAVTRKETTETHGRTFVELSHTILAGPVRIAGREVGDLLTEANQRVLTDLAFEDGVTHSEWRVTEAGEPVLMEIAARTPGDGISLLYHLACGVPLEAPVIGIALGEQTDYPRPRRWARQVYLEHRPGVLRDVTIDWPDEQVRWIGEADLWPTVRPGEPGDPPTLRAVLALKPPGTELSPLTCSDDRAVTFLIDADDEADLNRLEEQVRAAITLTIE